MMTADTQHEFAIRLLESVLLQHRGLAKQWLACAEKSGHIEAAHELGILYEEDDETQLACEHYYQAARKGHACACLDMALWYLHHDTNKKAFAWFLCAAYGGIAMAQYAVAWCYEFGYGTTGKNLKRALEWYQVAFRNNNMHAQLALGRWYLHGIYDCKTNECILQPDRQKSFDLLIPLAENEHNPIAEFGVGVCFDFGYGVQEPEPMLAVSWYTLAARQGLRDAQYNLALCYKNGSGVDQDLKKALKWFQRAADQDDHDAQKQIIYLLCQEPLVQITRCY